MLREYETFYVLKTDAPDDRIEKVAEKVNRAVDAHSGTTLGFDDWGVRKLAYPIQKKDRGRIIIVGYCAAPAAVSELERELRYDDVVVRYTTRVLGAAADPETAKKGFADRAAATAKAHAEALEREKEREAERAARAAERRERRGFGDRGDRGGRSFDRGPQREEAPSSEGAKAAPAAPAAAAAAPDASADASATSADASSAKENTSEEGGE